jgi:succinate dehydrogenase / fumarate reductase cytochrome b subunit
MADMSKPRAEFRNIHVSDLATYQLPWAGRVSIAHRISGAVLFLLLPFVIWLFDVSVSSEMSFERFTSLFNAGALGLPGWFYRLVALGLIFCYLVHFFAGLRHLWMDATHSVTREQGRSTAVIVLLLSVLLTLLLGARLFRLF